MGRRKTFDCVEMKRRVQERIMAEYEAARDRYSSYTEFLQDTARSSEWMQSMLARLKAESGS